MFRRIQRWSAMWTVAALALIASHSTPPRLDNLPGRDSSAISVPQTSSRARSLFFGRLNQTVSAAHSPKLSNAAANASADAVAALFNSCYFKIYDSTQAATADTSVSGQTLLSTLRCNATAFGSSSAGVATANAITSDTDAAATGTATWFRVLKSDNSTVVMDGSVGTSGADVNLATVSIVQHATVSITAFTYTQSKS